MRLDTGGGKTVTLSDIVDEWGGYRVVIAHRQELVGQLSLTLARYGVRHHIVAAEKTRRAIAKSHVEELGYCLYDPNAPVIVASVDTLVRNELPPHIAAQVLLWIVDEGHHLVVDNKWHTAISKFTNPECRGLLPTATPKRADGKGLGRGQGGVADVMVQGPPMRWLIDQGYLTDYRIVCPTSDMQVLAEVSASGDWSTKALREAAERSHIVGDVVKAYCEYAQGKLGITFATDVKTAGEMTAAYRLAGVRAETLTGKTDDHVRRMILRKFAAREVQQIVAVDIISEGFDLPAIEVASMARPTQSLALYMQQFGRTLRTMPGKDRALILDHVGNVIRHQGPPDRPRPWTLNAAERRSSTAPADALPLRVCARPIDDAWPAGCFQPYLRSERTCPHCGYYPEPKTRTTPAAVDGDMAELDAETLAAMRKPIEEADRTYQEVRDHYGKMRLPHAMVMTHVNHHARRQDALATLREAMGRFGGACIADGMRTDSQIQRAFYLTFGEDVLTAQARGRAEALELAEKINLHLGRKVA